MHKRRLVISRGRQHRKAVAIVMAITLLAGIGLASAATTPGVGALVVSPKADRSSPQNLADTTLKGDVYIFLNRDNVSQVAFSLDGKQVSVERVAPFDLETTAADGSAKRLDTTTLTKGSHKIVAVVATSSQRTRTFSATFQIDNSVATTTTTTKPSTTTTTAKPTTTTTKPTTTTAKPTTTTTAKPTLPQSFNPGNLNGTATVPAGMGLENVSQPNHVIGTGTPASCTSAAVVSAVSAGGVITFNCGPNPTTITLTETAKVKNSTAKVVIDGGGLVTLSGGGKNRILYTDTCDTSLGSVSGNCLYAPTTPQVTVQNITFANGNATNSTYVSPGDPPNGGSNGGGAIFQLGGRLKVVKSVFVSNTCATNGPDLGGGAIRVLAQHSDTPNNLDGSQAARGQYPVYIVQSTFGGASGQGNNCSNGGAVSTLRTPLTVLNSVMSYNNAIGCCANPAWDGTPGGGSGGAFYSDGDTYDMTINGSIIQNNTAKAGGSSIFFVSNDLTGHLSVLNSNSSNNAYAPNGQPNNAHFENYPGMFYLGSGKPDFTGSTIK